ncbi:MAG: PKD domain-containing protein, partial [Ferruginibacter sp.]
NSTTWATSANGTPTTGTGLTFTPTFANTGVDTVKLYVTDSHGCKDTAFSYVTTFDTPNVNFNVAPDSQSCAPVNVQFFDQTTGTVPTTWSWDFGDGSPVSNIKDPFHNYPLDGSYHVTLTVSDANGCTGTKTKFNYMQLEHPVASFTVNDSVGCAPFSVVFDGSASSSPHGITLYTWQPVTGSVIPFNHPTDTLPYTYGNAGSYDVALIVTDAKGCKDTLIKNAYITVSTATNPDTILLRRATVQGMRNVRVDFEAYPFSDFSEYYLMRYNTPFQVWVKVDSSTSQTTSTMFDSLPDLNTENFGYQYAVLIKNQCDRLSSLNRSPKHKTVNASLQSLTDAIKVKWNAYNGWGSVLQYDIYRSTGYSYNPNSFTFIATVPSTQLEYIDSTTFCLDSAYYRVLAVEQNGNLQQAWSDVAGGVPIHNSPITRMEMLYASVENDSVAEISWKPYSGYKPKSYVLEKSLDGIVWFELADLPLTQEKYVDDDVLVDELSYQYRVFAQDSCGDMSRLGNVGKTILLSAELNIEDAVILKWTPYIKWENGVKYYDIEVFDEAFGWKQVTIVAGDVTTFTDYKTQIKQGTYCYRVRAHEDKEEEAASTSNVDCVTFTPRIFLPNAFTPNGDGNNDVFSIGALNVKSASYTIYDRWGRVVFEGGSINDVWDGNDKGKAVPEGVYMYRISAIGVDDVKLTYNGSITIIR